MSLMSLRKELFWTRIILGLFYLIIVFLDISIHSDYEKFHNEYRYIIESCATKSEINYIKNSIMPSAFKEVKGARTIKR